MYVDSKNHPVSDEEIAAKISFIDLARKKADKEKIALQIEYLHQQQILLTESFLVDGMATALAATESAAEDMAEIQEKREVLKNIIDVEDLSDYEDIKDALDDFKVSIRDLSRKDLSKLEDSLSGLVIDGVILILRKAIWDPMSSIKNDCLSEMQSAQSSYTDSLRVINNNHEEIITYEAARKFLSYYMYGEAHSDVANVLLDEILNNYDDVIKMMAEEGFWDAAGEFTGGLSSFVELALEARDVVNWTYDATFEWINASANVQYKLSTTQLHEAAPYTLRLANSPLVEFEVHSPVEIRLYDSQGRVTGMINGKVQAQIPYSYISGNKVILFSPYGSYNCEIGGTGEGSYDLSVVRSIGTERNEFQANDYPVSVDATHRMQVEWESLSMDSKGIPIQIDSDGDGVFEKERIAKRKTTIRSKTASILVWVFGGVAIVATAYFAVRSQKKPKKLQILIVLLLFSGVALSIWWYTQSPPMSFSTENLTSGLRDSLQQLREKFESDDTSQSVQREQEVEGDGIGDVRDDNPDEKDSNTPPTSTPFSCPGSLSTRLHVGGYACVDPEPPVASNYVRLGPGTDRAAAGLIPPGGVMEILDGPECDQGYIWWEVRAEDTGVEGWTVEGDDEYWLLPCETKNSCGE